MTIKSFFFQIKNLYTNISFLYNLLFLYLKIYKQQGKRRSAQLNMTCFEPALTPTRKP